MPFILLTGCALTLTLGGLIRRRKKAEARVVPLLKKDCPFETLVERVMGMPDGIEQEVRTLSAEPLSTNRPEMSRAEKEAEARWKKAFWGAAAADASYPAIEVWMRWHTVDDKMFQALSHLSGEQVNGVADMVHLADMKGYAVESAGFASKLIGHLGEWHAQEHFVGAGLDVHMPLTSNMPGWDMTLNDHAVNIKTVADAKLAALQHFSDNAHIPIVVPGDAANIPNDALHFNPGDHIDAAALHGDHLTIVDHALSHKAMMGEVAHATSVMHDPGVHLHFPWITMAVSGFREARLIAKGHTDMERALKNVAIDTVAVGGGAAAGAKAGAMIGLFGGPVGAVIGGVLGGIAGAMGGRMVGNHVKQAPLRDADAAFQRAKTGYENKSKALTVYLDSEWKKCTSEESHRMKTAAESEKSSLLALIAQKRAEVEAQGRVSKDYARTRLQAVGDHLEALHQWESEKVRSRLSRLQRLAPSLFAPDAEAAIRLHAQEVASWKARAQTLVARWTDAPGDSVGYFNLLLEVEDARSEVVTTLNQLKHTRMQAVRTTAAEHQAALARLAQKRKEAVTRMKARWNTLTAEVESKIRPFIDSVKSAEQSLRIELRKAGISC